MAKTSKLQAFYSSAQWINFRLQVIAEHAARLGGLKCDVCRERILDATKAHVHHLVELTDENVDDVMVSLNSDLVQVVHDGCHNKVHKRSIQTTNERQTYLVYGPPLSGKSSYVREHMKRGDLIVDFDLLFKGLSMLELYDKPNDLLMNVRAVHNLLLDHVKTRFGKWESAWIIGGYADKYKRGKLIADLGAEPIFIKASKEECLMRLGADLKRSAHKEEWTKYIERWFEQYTE